MQFLIAEVADLLAACDPPAPDTRHPRAIARREGSFCLLDHLLLGYNFIAK